jgi:hypothetical protein
VFHRGDGLFLSSATKDAGESILWPITGIFRRMTSVSSIGLRDNFLTDILRE